MSCGYMCVVSCRVRLPLPVHQPLSSGKYSPSNIILYHHLEQNCNRLILCFISHQSVCKLYWSWHWLTDHQPHSPLSRLKASVRSENGLIYWVMVLWLAMQQAAYLIPRVFMWRDAVSPPGKSLSSFFLLSWVPPSLQRRLLQLFS